MKYVWDKAIQVNTYFKYLSSEFVIFVLAVTSVAACLWLAMVAVWCPPRGLTAFVSCLGRVLLLFKYFEVRVFRLIMPFAVVMLLYMPLSTVLPVQPA